MLLKRCMSSLRDQLLSKTMPQWGSQADALRDSIRVDRASGLWLYDDESTKRYLDMASGMYCSNAGHAQPSIVDAVRRQLESCDFVESRYALTSVRMRAADAVASLLPGDLEHVYFCCSGAEANEAAIVVARNFTSKRKILARYRSYHGGTSGALSLSGDARRAARLHTMGDVVHLSHVEPEGALSWGDSDEERVDRWCRYAEDVIDAEGADTVAAMHIEAVTSPANGLLVPPRGYLAAVQQLCRERGVLLVCDEVLVGFGRTGKMFGFEHGGDAIVPDLVTMAKGISNGAVPVGAVAARRHIGEYFHEHPIGIGSTYNAHPTGLAAVEATVALHRKLGLAERAAQLEPLMKRLNDALCARFPELIVGHRTIGLLSVIDTTLSDDQFTALRAHLYEHELFVIHRQRSLVLSPPLTIEAEELEFAYTQMSKALNAFLEESED
jgi:adenosylmethionine-8-amino-7-oxononanoate aminotransferase